MNRARLIRIDAPPAGTPLQPGLACLTAHSHDSRFVSMRNFQVRGDLVQHDDAWALIPHKLVGGLRRRPRASRSCGRTPPRPAGSTAPPSTSWPAGADRPAARSPRRPRAEPAAQLHARPAGAIESTGPAPPPVTGIIERLASSDLAARMVPPWGGRGMLGLIGRAAYPPIRPRSDYPVIVD